MTASLSPSQCADLHNSFIGLSKPAKLACLNLIIRIGMFGPVPFDVHILAPIAGCGPTMWVTRIWPAVQHRFVVQDDFVGLAGFEIGPSKQSVAARTAALAKHEQLRERKRAQLSLIADNSPPENPASQPAHTSRSSAIAEKNAAVSTSDAGKKPANVAANAEATEAGGVSDAGSAPAAPARAHPLSPSSDSGFIGDSEGERGGSGGNGAASTQPAQKLVAPRTQRPRRSDAPAQALRFPPEWQPNAAGEAEARRHGYEPAEIAERFRLYYVARGEVRADWDAEFIRWVRRQAAYDGAPRQGYMMTAGGGAKPAEAAATPETEAGKALAKRLEPLRKEAALGMRDAPSPNLFRQFSARDDAALAEAHRWLGYCEAWLRAGRPGSLRPPTWLDLSSPNTRARTLERLGELESDLSEIAIAAATPERRAADG